jgi:ribosomal protein S27AE
MDVLCPACGAPAQEVQNPFYGTGLAVHRNLIECGHCSGVAIVNNTAAAEAAGPRTATASNPLRRMLRRAWPIAGTGGRR